MNAITSSVKLPRTNRPPDDSKRSAPEARLDFLVIDEIKSAFKKGNHIQSAEELRV